MDKEDQISIWGAITLLGVACLTIMVGCVIVPGLNEISQAVGITKNASLLVTLPSLGVVLFGSFAGKIIDKYGAYLAICWGLLFYGFLGFGGAFLISLPFSVVFLIIDRFLLGGACALVMSSGTALISFFYTGEKRLKMIAVQGMSIELGGVIFLSVGGYLAAINWKYPFALYLMAWVFLIMVVSFIRKPKVFDKSLKSEFIHSGGKKADLRIVYLSAFISLTCFFTGTILIPIQFNMLGIGAAQTGYFLSFVSVVAVCAAGFMPKFVSNLGEYKTLFFAFVCYIFGHIIYAISSSFIFFVFGAVFMGIGFGLSIPLANHMTVQKSLPQNRGKNLSYLAICIYSGQFFSSFMEMIPGKLSYVFISAGFLAFAMSIFLVSLKRGYEK